LFIKFLKKLLLVAVIFSVSGCGGSGSNASDNSYMPEPSLPFEAGIRSVLEPVASGFTGVEYPIQLYLPKNRITGKKYPVIYVLDAEWHLKRVADSLDRLELEAIIIGIENFVDAQYKHREDYSQWPLAQDYFDFIVNELAPKLEPNYPIDTSKRAILGHSYTGLFAGLAMIMDDPQAPFFTRHVSFDGSFWAHTEITPQLISDRGVLDERLKSKAILIAARGKVSNGRYVDWFQAMLEYEQFKGLEMIKLEYDVDHIPVVEHAMDDAMKALLIDQ
jgi:hypothetical protein